MSERLRGSAEWLRARLAAPLLVLLATACIFDVGTKRLPIAGDYRLEIWDGGQTYRVVRGNEGGDVGGIFGGTVDSLAWNRAYLAAKRHAMDGSERDGIMLLRLRDGQLQGPFTNEEFVARGHYDTLLSGLQLRPIREVARGL